MTTGFHVGLRGCEGRGLCRERRFVGADGTDNDVGYQPMSPEQRSYAIGGDDGKCLASPAEHMCNTFVIDIEVTFSRRRTSICHHDAFHVATEGLPEIR